VQEKIKRHRLPVLRDLRSNLPRDAPARSQYPQALLDHFSLAGKILVERELLLVRFSNVVWR
jgi:hypothetical protein